MSLTKKTLSVRSLAFASLAPSLFVITLGSVIASAGAPESFIYQGRLTKNDGSPASGVMTITFQIYNPTADCLLYEEKHTGLSVLTTEGHFTLAVGSGVTSTKRTTNDPALAMPLIFSNGPSPIRASGSANCTTGYTAGANDARKLRVIVSDGTVTDTLAPDQVIGSVPFAMTAQTLQGKQPGDFIQTNATTTQAALDALVGGTSTLYLRTDGAGASLNNQRLTSVAAPTAATDAANKQYCDSKLAGQAISATAPGNGQILVWNSTASQWQAGAVTDTSVQAHARASQTGCTAGQASRWDGTAWSCVAVGGGGSGGGATTHSTAYEDIVLTSASSKILNVKTTDGGSVKLPDATALDLGGPHFTIFNNGVHPLPVFNNTGAFVGSVTTGSASRAFLFNKATAAGEWSLDTNTSSNAIEKWITDTTTIPGMANMSYDVISSSPPVHKLIIAYSVTTSGVTDLWARTVEVDTSTKSVTWGSPVSIETNVGNSGGTSTVGLSATSAVIAQGYPLRLRAVTISGTSITSGGPTFDCAINQNIRKISASMVLCFGYSSGLAVSVFNVAGTTLSAGPSGTVTGGGSSGNVGIPTYFNNKVIVPYCSYSSPTSTWIATFDATETASNGLSNLDNESNLSVDNTCNLSGGYQTFQSPYIPIDSTNIWALTSNMYNNKAVKVTVGNTSSIVATVDLSNAGSVISIGGSHFLERTTAPSGRWPVTNLASLSLGPEEKSASCGGMYRYELGRCFFLGESSGKQYIRFDVGY